jgi:SAM-dependent methyltransferase
MRSFFKTHLPTVYNFVKSIYHKSYLHKRSTRIEKEKHREWVKIRLVDDLKLLATVFNNECIVHNGPFHGLKYITRSSGSAFLPKIMGSYEEPIHEWIDQVIRQSYDLIIDVGCAEGYYTTGFASKAPDTKVVAYDIDTEAIQNAKELAMLNQVHNIEFKSECTHSELNSLCKENTLVFCDIEGFENMLLDPEKVPNLKHADMIIECHDFLIEGTTELLVSRFIKTHRIRIIVDYPGKLKQYQTPSAYTNQQFDRITNEYRQKGTKFMFLKHL